MVESFSQFGQDRFIDEHVFGGATGGFFVDIGANDGVTLSNTYLFETLRGWDGICVEPMPETFAKLRANRSCRCVRGAITPVAGTQQFTQVSGYGEMLSALTDRMDPQHAQRIDETLRLQGGEKRTIDVQCFTFNDVMRDAGVGQIDYCSIDTEGSELDILRSIDYSKYAPRCLSVEDNQHYRAINRVLGPRGYKVVEKLGTDLVYVTADQVRRMRPVGLLRFGAKPMRLAQKVARRVGHVLKLTR